MAALTIDDVRIVWQRTPGWSWGSLRETLQYRAKDLDERLVDGMIYTVRQYENYDSPFPTTDYELYKILNR